MKIGETVQPCVDCPAVPGQYFELGDGEVAICPVGEDSCRVISVYVSDNELTAIDETIDISSYKPAIEACSRPEITAEQVRRKGLAGIIGFKKHVAVSTCPDTKTTKIIEV
jgi:hypothetical protein